MRISGTFRGHSFRQGPGVDTGLGTGAALGREEEEEEEEEEEGRWKH